MQPIANKRRNLVLALASVSLLGSSCWPEKNPNPVKLAVIDETIFCSAWAMHQAVTRLLFTKPLATRSLLREWFFRNKQAEGELIFDAAGQPTAVVAGGATRPN
jgi:hypothetical protein